MGAPRDVYLNAQLLDLTESTTTRRTVRRDKSKPRINKEKEVRNTINF